MAVKTVRVSDLSGKQADDDEMAKLVIHEHPQYQGPITLDVLPDEIGELPESEAYVSIEVIQPGARTGQKALLSLDHFNKLAASEDMNTVLIRAVADTHQQGGKQEAPRRRRGRQPKIGARGEKIDYSQPEHAGFPHRGRVSPEEAAYVRDHLDEVNKRLAAAGVRTLDPADAKIKARYGLK